MPDGPDFDRTFWPMLHLVVSAGDEMWPALIEEWLDRATRIVFPEMRDELTSRGPLRRRRPDDEEPVGSPGSAWADVRLSYYGSSRLRPSVTEPAFSDQSLAGLIADLREGGERGVPGRRRASSKRPFQALLWMRRLGRRGLWTPMEVDNPQECGRFEVFNAGADRLKWLQASPHPQAFDGGDRGEEFANRWFRFACAAASRRPVLGGGLGLAHFGWSRWEAENLPASWMSGRSAQIAARARSHPRGPFWAMILGRPVAEKLGGVAELTRMDVFHAVRDLGNGSVACRVTEHWRDYGPAEERRVAEALGPWLGTVSSG